MQQIDAVLNASLSLFRSSRLRKVFEVSRIASARYSLILSLIIYIIADMFIDYSGLWELHEQQ